MKKIYSFLILFLLSYTAADVLAQEIPVKFSSDDGIEEYVYFVRFNRQASVYWTADHEVSGELTQKALMAEGTDLIQRWKFVLVDEDLEPGVFYIIHDESGEYVTYTDGGITDSYGKPIPVTAENPESSGYYYIDKGITPGKFKFEYRENLGGWVIMDVTNGNSLNDRQGRSICKYGPDAGNVVIFTLAGIPAINVNTTSLSFGSLQNKKFEAHLIVSGRYLEEDIEVSFEGDDADKFTAAPPANYRGGLLTITFTPAEVKNHVATMHLKSGTVDVAIALTGSVYLESDLPKISSEDDSDVQWYYVQFLRVAGENLAWTASTAMGEVSQKAIVAGAPDAKQLWKICGSWEEGFTLVNSAIGGELLYNQNLDQTPIVEGLREGKGDALFPYATDTYIVTNAGSYGNQFNFVRDQNGYWQLFNRDINSAPTNATRDPLGFDARYIYDRDGDEIRQYSASTDRTQIVFTEVKPMIITSVGTSTLIKASAGETTELKVLVTGVGTTADITASLTGDAVFTLDPNSLPANGGELTLTFSPVSDEEFYMASLKLSSEGADDLIVSISGTNGRPVFSLEDDVWHYIQFKRRANDRKVWQGNGIDATITQVVREEGNPNQQWKFLGTPGGLVIENRAGGQLAFPRTADGNISGDPNAILTDEGDLALLRYSDIRDEWEFELENYEGATYGGGGLNDRSGSYVCLYSVGDGGGPLLFYPVEVEEVGRKLISVSTTSVSMTAPVGGTATAKISVAGLGISGTITAAFTGDGFTISDNSIPVTGGEITITFAPTEMGNYAASLTLSNSEVDDVVVSITGNTPPEFSTTTNEVWYYIQFERQASKAKVWQGNGINEIVTQETMEADNYSQHWKFVGVWDDDFVVENREGGQLFFEKDEDDDADGLAFLVEDGDQMAFVVDKAKWALQVYFYFNENDWGVLNDFEGEGTDIGIYYLGDAGSHLIFIPVDTETGIKAPVIDPDDQVIATRYFTLHGIEIKKPATTGIYIVKQIYASGITKATKVFVHIR